MADCYMARKDYPKVKKALDLAEPFYHQFRIKSKNQLHYLTLRKEWGIAQGDFQVAVAATQQWVAHRDSLRQTMTANLIKLVHSFSEFQNQNLKRDAGIQKESVSRLRKASQPKTSAKRPGTKTTINS